MNSTLNALGPTLLIGAALCVIGVVAALIYVHRYICDGSDPAAAAAADAGDRSQESGVGSQPLNSQLPNSQPGFVTVCAWCQPPVKPPPGAQITHGICPACERLHFAELSERDGKPCA